MRKWILYAFFFGLIVYPYSFYEIKIPLLILIIFFSIFKMLTTGKINIDKSVFFLFTYYIFISIFYILYGIVNTNAYSGSFLYLFALYVIFPIVYFFILNVIQKDYKALVYIDKLFVLSAIFISIVMFLAVVNKRGQLAKELLFLIEPVNNVDIRTVKDVVKINFNGISSLVFLFPYIFGLFLLDYKKRTVKNNFIFIICLIMSGYAVFISGRRALIILLLFSVLMTIVFKMSKVAGFLFNKKTILLGVFCIVLALPFVNYKKIYESTSSTLSFALNINYHKDSSASDESRKKQASSFIEYIVKKPVLGYGHGATMAKVMRSKSKPWRYELSYLDLLFHTGVLGLFLYGLGPLWIIASLYKIIKINKFYSNKSFSVLMGFISILIAYVTNPYLNAFDIQWVIYFPILFIIIVNRDKNRMSNG